MNIVKYWAVRLANSAIQRTLENPRTTIGGAAGGFLATLTAAFSAQGCHLSAINYVEIYAAFQAGGALLTDGNKALVHHDDGQVSTVPIDPGPRTSGDAAHDQAGQG